jgi:hypothetical protein
MEVPMTYESTDVPPSPPPAKSWRFGLIVGLSIGLALAVSRAVEKGLEPSLGHSGALLVSVVAAVLVGGLVAFVATWLSRRKGGPPK